MTNVVCTPLGYVAWRVDMDGRRVETGVVGGGGGEGTMVVCGRALIVSSHLSPYCSAKYSARSCKEGKDLVADLLILLYAQTQRLLSFLALAGCLLWTRS